MNTDNVELAPVWVCVDCYFAHHYGAHQDDAGHWHAGESDTPADREPLALIPDGLDVSDWTDSETGEGMDDFSWSRCDGCGSTLGGARYRLAVWEQVTA